MLRIAHLSDLHVMASMGAEWRRILFNKRVTGLANLVLHRGRVFRSEYLHAVLDDAARHADQIVVTGDITNLALESEYEEARRLLRALARHAEVTVVPGNHDAYLSGLYHERRFPRYFGEFQVGDLPTLAVHLPAGPYPCVKLRGPVAIVAMSSAVPRPPFVASGTLGQPQLAALAKVLAHPEVAARTPVVLVHHPPVSGRGRLARLRDGLVDGAALRACLASLPRGLVLYGHVHVRRRCLLRTAAGALDVVCASGAALDHADPSVRAGYNLYEIDGSGAIAAVGARVVDASGTALQPVAIPRETRCA